MSSNYFETDLQIDYQRIHNAIHKLPHELVYSDIYPWFDIKMLRREKILRRIELNYQDVDPEVGTYACFSYGKDQWLGKCKVLDPSFIVHNALEKTQLDFKEMSYREICATTMEYEKFGTVSAIVVYKDSTGRYITIQGTARLRFIQSLGLKTIKAFVVDTENQYALNRSAYLLKARDQGFLISTDVLEDLAKHPSTPLYCPDLTPAEMNLLMGPSLGDKMDAVLKDLTQGTFECKKLLSL